MAAYGYVRNPFADKLWYWPAGHYCYYYVYHPAAPVARQMTVPMPAAAVHDGRPPLNPGAVPFSPEEGHKPASLSEVKVIPPFLPHQLTALPRMHYFTTPPPLLHPPPPVLPQAPPQGSGFKSADFEPMRRKMKAIWKPKVGKDTDQKPAQPHADQPPAALHGKTTIMIRNIPNSLKRVDLLNILDNHCCEENKLIDRELAGSCRSEYDFVYLPIDYRTKGNKGYAFVNFTSVVGPKRMWRAYHGFKWEKSPKICEICPAVLQGKDALLHSLRYRVFPAEHYQPQMAEATPRDGSNNAPFVSIGFGRRSTYRP